jgi:hypothetical protein
MRYLFIACLLFCSLSSFSQQVDSNFTKLLSEPDKYHNKIVEIVGYVNFEFEGDYIRLDSTTYSNRIWIEGVPKELLRKKYFGNLNGRRVMIEGRYNKNLLGHMSMFKGTLTDVTRLDVY